jgi:hypothetical protein
MIDRAVERRLITVRDRARAASEKPIPPRVQAYLKGETIAVPVASLPSGGKERRRAKRMAMASEALVRRSGGFNFQVVLNDISMSGCRVEMLEPCEVGDWLIARFPQLEPLGSRVCWTQGTTTGVQFQTSVHPAVFDGLLARISEGSVFRA